MIIRYLVVDPDDEDEVLLYQVPQHSRNEDVFVWMLKKAGLEFVTLESKPNLQKVD